jgi:hypothetical protein
VNQDTIMNEFIQRYFLEVENRNLTLDEIMSRPRWKRVWYYWKSLERFEGKPKSDMTLDEVKKIYGD